MTFEQWMAAVDTQVSTRTGLSVHDLPDMPYRDQYDARYTPGQAAEEALSEAGW